MAKDKKTEKKPDITVTFTEDGPDISWPKGMQDMEVVANLGRLAAKKVDEKDLGEAERELVRAFQEERGRRLEEAEKD